MRLFENLLKFLLKNSRMNNTFRRACFVLACIVAFTTTYSLLLPAITLEDSVAAEMDGFYMEDLTGSSSDDVIIEDEDESEYYEEEPGDEDSSVNEVTDAWDQNEENVEQTDKTQSVSETTTSENSPSEQGEESGVIGISEDVESDPEVIPNALSELTAEAEGISVRIEFKEEQVLPEGTTLEVRLIDSKKEPDLYKDYYDRAVKEMADRSLGNVCHARFFVLSAFSEGEPVELKGDAKVSVIYEDEYLANGDETAQILTLYEERVGVLESSMCVQDGTEVKNPAAGAVTGFTYEIDRFDQVAVATCLSAVREEESATDSAADSVAEVEGEESVVELAEDSEEEENVAESAAEASVDGVRGTESAAGSAEEVVSTPSEIEDVVDPAESVAESSGTESMAESIVSAVEDIEEPAFPVKRTVPVEGADYSIRVEYDEAAGLPYNAVISASAVAEESEEYQNYREQALAAVVEKNPELSEQEALKLLCLFKLTITDADGNRLDPKAPLSISVEIGEGLDAEAQVHAVRFAEEEAKEAAPAPAKKMMKAPKSVRRSAAAAPAVDEAENDGEGAAVFEAGNSSSVYGIVGTVIEKNVLASDGRNYMVKVSYSADSGIPEGAELTVEEILGVSEEYAEYVSKTENALGMEEGSAGYIRLFDIKIVDQDDHSVKYQPKEGTTVDVRIELADAQSEPLSVVHFGEEPEVVEATQEEAAEGVELSFEAGSFSVYAIVDLAPAETAVSVDDLDGNSYYLSVDKGNNRYYFTNDLNTVPRIVKTTTLDSASTFTFEATEADEQGNSFYIYTYDDEGNKKYVNRTSDGKFSFGEEATTKYTVTIHTEGTPKSFHIYHRVDPKNYYTWHMNGDFEFAKISKNNNNKIILTQIGSDDSTPSDPYGLDGESLGILWNVNDVSGSAMMSTVGTANSQIIPSDGSAKVTESIAVLKNKSTTVKIDPVSRTDRVFVAQNSNISMWTFTCCGPAEYYITTVVNGQLKYVRFNDSETLGTGDKGISLVDEADERCKITVTEGTGAYSGKYKFSSNGRTLYNNNGNFFTKAESENGQNVWMYFAEQSTLNDDDFVVYTAKKVSVSGPVNPDGTIDYDVKDGDQVVLYTRIWNETTLEYEYYAIDYDGMLVRTYMSGDNISWVGSKINTMLWNFTEYHTIDADGNETDIPNYYYELQNNYSGKYIAPQVSGVGFLADSPVGINLNGRRYNEYYSTILAWDDPYYDYATLMADNYQLVSAPMSKAEDFYFAVMEPQMEEAYLSTVATVDSEPFGITLKMQNYGSVGSNNRSQEQTDVLQNLTYNQWSGVKNLLTKYIADGESYPTSTLTGNSLSALYSTALTVNHQFLLSTYQETGYFEYDSTQNFAHLITSADDPWYGKDSPNGGIYDVGDFVIYNQIASTTESTGDTRRHGQFFPYNDLVENAIITNMVNDTDIHGNPLSSLDPEKGEKLYKIQFKNQANEDPQYVDFFFGMEMDASFMQSASGLDAWGHDLIFEFSGDDDFWLYIDDVLVLDLGGIHSALDGTVNFRTGKVIDNNKESTLRERFETAYKAQYPDKTNDEINEWLNGIFKDDGTNTGTVFKDYSGHTMKMFYMERGAGASNLHMRFNLAPYVNGEVQLEKEVSGTDNADASFPFQIWYENKTSTRMEQVGSTGHDFSVCDTITGDPIRHADTYTVGGVSYDHVYFLKPGQTASITLPDESTKYYFVECGVDTTTYDSVKANDVELDGTTVTGSSTLKDYQIDTDTVSRRKKVIYNNHVSDTAQKTLTVTKRLWREFEKTTEIHSGTGTDADNTNFRFRVYIGEGSDLTIDGVGYAVYNIGKYYVKDRYGNYCIWQNGGFVSTGKTVFSELSTEKPQGEWKSEAEQATFYSSPGGAIDNIKAGYSVEIPGLMAGTPYYIEERAEETPSGYNLIGYTTTEGAYSAAAQGTPGNSGTITATDTNRTVSVHNQHGYGLVANKVWSDAPFMASHDDIYFGVYLDGVLINDTVRQLHHPATSINWFFPELKQNKTLNDYQVYELELTTPEGRSISVDPATGSVSGYTAVTKKEANDSINVGGVSNEHGYSVSYSYTVGYDRQVLTAEEIANKVHSRTDTISNSRPGIKIMKTDLGGSPLAGAKFVLTDESGTIRKNFTSAEDGLIVVSYLENDKVYTLTETAAPYGYQTLIDSITIEKKVDEDGKTSVYVNGQRVVGEVKDSSNAVLYSVTQVDDPSATNMPTITIRNKDYTLKAVKVDAYSNEPMKDVKFKLYKQVYESVNGVTNHNYPMPDYNPMIGYDNLITDENGVIPGIFMKNSETPVGLTAGTYYLREETPSGYNSLGFDIRITISDTGEVTLQKAIRPTQSGHWTFGEVSNSIADVAYSDGIMQITVKNTPKDPVRIKKLDMTDQTALEGVGFNLYKIAQIGENGLPRDGEEPVISGSTNGDGILLLGGLEENISYYLYETQPLPGYNMLTAPVVITTVGSSTVNASLNGAPLVCAQVTDENGNHVWEITVYNSTGYELPSTGGPGTRASTLFGATLILISLSALALLRRKRA